jgi:hypothetical protein
VKDPIAEAQKRDLIPEARQKTKRQVRRQITLPIALGVVVLAAIIVLLVRRGVGTPSAWADVSLVFLLVPVFIVGLIIFFVLAALFVISLQLTIEIPYLTFQIYDGIRSAHSGVRRVTSMITRPFFIPSAIRAALKAGLRSIRMIFIRP